MQDEFSKKLEEKEQNLKQVQEDNQKMLDNWMKEREEIIQKQLEEERQVSYCSGQLHSKILFHVAQ